MKKLLLLIALYVSLNADICWNIDRNEWIGFDWLIEPTVESNSVDEELRSMFTYQTTKDSYSCQYTGEYLYESNN